MRARSRAVLFSKRNTCATPSSTFAGCDRGQHVLQMKCVGGGHEDGIDFRRAAQFRARIKCQRDVEFRSRSPGLGQVAPRERCNLAGLGQREPGHKPSHRMQAKAEDTEANHRSVTAERAKTAEESSSAFLKRSRRFLALARSVVPVTDNPGGLNTTGI